MLLKITFKSYLKYQYSMYSVWSNSAECVNQRILVNLCPQNYLIPRFNKKYEWLGRAHSMHTFSYVDCNTIRL